MAGVTGGKKSRANILEKSTIQIKGFIYRILLFAHLDLDVAKPHMETHQRALFDPQGTFRAPDHAGQNLRRFVPHHA